MRRKKQYKFLIFDDLSFHIRSTAKKQGNSIYSSTIILIAVYRFILGSLRYFYDLRSTGDESVQAVSGSGELRLPQVGVDFVGGGYGGMPQDALGFHLANASLIEDGGHAVAELMRGDLRC